MYTRWGKLNVYVTEGRLRIDYSLAENSIRPLVVGHKNCLFCDGVADAIALANLYSLVKKAKVNGIEHYAYLILLFTVLPQASIVNDIETLLPITTIEAEREAA